MQIIFLFRFLTLHILRVNWGRMKYKTKNKGVSLLIALGTSYLLLTVVMIILFAVARSLEQSANIERSNQIFFAAESGIESAFFHHNARGAGTHFVGDDTSQQILHQVISALVNWKIDGRVDPITGILKENQTIQIPFFWDSATTPLDTPFEENLNIASEGFTLSFTREGIPDGFDFGTEEEEILIDWKISRKHPTEGLQTFLPKDEGGCLGETEFICKSGLPATIGSGDSIAGKRIPCTSVDNCPTTLSDFLSEGNNFQLVFRPILPFESVDESQKIPGIPFTLTTDGTPMPKSAYDIVADIAQGDFTQKLELTIPEKTAIGSFDYVIFD